MDALSLVPSYWFIFKNNQLLLTKIGNTYHLPAIAIGNEEDTISVEFFSNELQPHFLRCFYIGKLNQIDCYGVELDINAILPIDFHLVSLRASFDALETNLLQSAVKAHSILTWDNHTQFCGKCGNKTLLKPNAFERICENCGLAIYPRISPAIIVLIEKDDQILMARSPHFTPGAYGLIAGFVELGENVEEAVHREVKEEVNIEIKNLNYFGSQAWPFPDSLIIAFTAQYAAGEIVIDPNEIESAGWYHPDNIPGLPATRNSIARQLIDHFIEKQKKSKNHG